MASLSDRCVHRTQSYSAVEHGARVARAQREIYEYVLQRKYRAVAAVMVDLLHPGNQGALPPSPRALYYKAVDLGLEAL